jgi:hypothetical protein
MNPPTDAINVHVAAESTVPWLERFRALIIATYGVDPWAESQPPATLTVVPVATQPLPTAKPSTEQHSGTPPAAVVEHPSAWAAAVRIGEVRARRRAQGLDTSVRAIATEVGCSRGHAGDCLKIRDAFSDALLYFIAENGTQDDGRARLARLSFRALRSLARLPTHLARIREVRRWRNPVDDSFSAKNEMMSG